MAEPRPTPLTEKQERELRALLPVALSVSRQYGETLQQATERILRVLRNALS